MLVRGNACSPPPYAMIIIPLFEQDIATLKTKRNNSVNKLAIILDGARLATADFEPFCRFHAIMLPCNACQAMSKAHKMKYTK